MLRFQHLLVVAAIALIAGACSSTSDDCTNDIDCTGTLVCRNGKCVADSCESGCPAGQYCNGAVCLECTEDQHCGQDCTNCSAQSTDKACVAGSCGCNTVADCNASQTCENNVCTGGCWPDCVGKCGGAPDGCDGTCDANCPAGQWCSTQACLACDTNEHCGTICSDCSAQTSNHVCISGSCGCVDTNDCAAGQDCLDGTCDGCEPDCSGKCGGASDGCSGACDSCPNAQWCDGQTCQVCNTAEHCGWECTNCAGQTRNKICINGQCGCLLGSDCAPAEDCINGSCSGCTPDCSGKCGGASDGCDGYCYSCSSGEWCDSQTCIVCDSDEHCGSTCADCSALSNNKACVGNACGCVDNDDCAAGEACDASNCSGCVPDCTGKCGGASDGCTGTCDSCPDAQWCDNQACSLCNTDEHCGWNCDDCAAQSSSQACIDGSCGCVTDNDCAAGEWCSNNACTACVVDAHCGNTVCIDCTNVDVEGTYCAGGSDSRYCACIDNQGCFSGRWCNVDTCQDCNDDEHCGSGCINCANQGNNKACVSGTCGCVDQDDCADGDICQDGSCTGCTPDCTDKCGGASDGCLGTCDQGCDGGEWCNNQACVVCNVDAHCGATCADCTDTDVNGDHCAGNVGGYWCACNEDGACLTGFYCDSSNDGVCTVCNDDQHCGPSCTNCSGQANNKKCVGNQCGCESINDCDSGYTCTGGVCTAAPDEICDNGVDDDGDDLEDCEDTLDCPNGTDCAGTNRVCNNGFCEMCWEIYCETHADCQDCTMEFCNLADNCCANCPSCLCP
jgi:hypothetical protein